MRLAWLPLWLVLFPSLAHAANEVDWNNPLGGDCALGSNFAPPDPTPDSQVFFPFATTYTVTCSGPTEWARMQVDAGVLTFDLGSSLLTLNDSAFTGEDTIVIRNASQVAVVTGSIAAFGVDLRSAGRLTWSGDTLSGTSMTLANNARYTQTAGSLSLSGTFLHGSGLVTIAAGSFLVGDLDVRSDFDYQAGALSVPALEVGIGGDYQQLAGALDASTFTQSGGLFHYAGAAFTATSFGQTGGTAQLDSNSFDVVSDLAVGGALIFGGATLDASTIAISGLLDFSGSALTATSALDLQGGTLDVSSGSVVTPSLTSTGALLFAGTTLTTGPMVLASGSSGSLSGTVVAGALDLQGTLSLLSGSLGVDTFSGTGEGFDFQGGSVMVGGGGLQIGANGPWPSTAMSVSMSLDVFDTVSIGQAATTPATLTVGAGASVTAGTVDVQNGALAMNGGLVTGDTVLRFDGNLSGYGSVDGRVTSQLGSSIAASGGPLSLGDPAQFAAVQLNGTLLPGSETLTLLSASFTNLPPLSSLTGGTLEVPGGLSMPTGHTLVGDGAVDGRVVLASGSIIAATGALTLGDPNAFDGFGGDGVLDTGPHTVTIRDRNAAQLGSLTTVGDDGGPGTLAAPNGLQLGASATLSGYGVVTANLDTEGLVHGEGPLPTDALELSGDVTGAGEFSGNIVFSGTYTPGNSPAQIDLENATLLGTAELVVEIGGVAPGSEHDALVASGQMTLGGALRVEWIDGFDPELGTSFVIVRAATLNGAFTSVNVPPSPSGLTLDIVQTGTELALVAAQAPAVPALPFALRAVLAAALLAVALVGGVGAVRRRRSPVATG